MYLKDKDYNKLNYKYPFAVLHAVQGLGFPLRIMQDLSQELQILRDAFAKYPVGQLAKQELFKEKNNLLKYNLYK